MLTGKTALVTGASRGIGKAIALKLAKEGADVIVNYVSSEESALKVQKEIESLGRKAYIYQCDIAKRDELEAMVAFTIEKFGKIDILVNNAGIVRYNTITDMSQKDWNDVVNTNLTGMFNLCQLVAPYMIKQNHGKIVNISSLAAVKMLPASYGYTATKAGISAFTKVLGTELIGNNINVNAIAPGIIITDMLDSLGDAAEAYKQQIPAKRFCDAEEVAELAYFLCQDISRYIVGQTIVIDGGLAL
ncbi:SDR family NAD(P)-dependent oxidoreductase [Anaerocolumna chitinilytica]|uniref:Beta-ketoacyl-ACP reductase n=1 Tax=Anaerocolumna chitinilytica TaxID=1727145 RepID=A0A7I8DLT1_9FIRM|nr:3-oxoacyl-ACP reductase family protein [Anaerocolumna chitinilytica]BCJ97236.1 beta-ketoacyl-ACP reductase [Anaerocolumna chitinilytica]